MTVSEFRKRFKHWDKLVDMEPILVTKDGAYSIFDDKCMRYDREDHMIEFWMNRYKKVFVQREEE